MMFVEVELSVAAALIVKQEVERQLCCNPSWPLEEVMVLY